jgi:hypothetical protein
VARRRGGQGAIIVVQLSCTRETAMRRRVRVASLMLAALVFVVANAAHAECAWIAWQWTVGGGEESGRNLPSGRIAAYGTQAACMADIRARARSIPMAKESGSKVFEHSTGSAVERANGTITSFECWPDTVDPRGPKTK